MHHLSGPALLLACVDLHFEGVGRLHITGYPDLEAVPGWFAGDVLSEAASSPEGNQLLIYYDVLSRLVEECKLVFPLLPKSSYGSKLVPSLPLGPGEVIIKAEGCDEYFKPGPGHHRGEDAPTRLRAPEAAGAFIPGPSIKMHQDASSSVLSMFLQC